MAIIKKYNLSGDEVGQLALDDSLLDGMANPQMIKDYLVAYRANQRQWSANTKGRSEVSHSSQKPHPQKGTGRARQGCLAAPQYKGGGRAFGPKPKFDQQVRVNKKEKRAVIKSLLVQKIQEQHVHVLSVEGLDKPRTKTIVDFLKKLNLTQKRVLFLGEDLYMSTGCEIEATLCEAVEGSSSESNKEAAANMANIISEKYNNLACSYEKRDAVVKSLRNVPKLSFSLLPNLNGYDVVLHQDIILLDGATDQLMAVLGGNK